MTSYARRNDLPNDPPLHWTAAAVYFICGRASRVRAAAAQWHYAIRRGACVVPSESTVDDWIRWLASDDPKMRKEAVRILGQLDATDRVPVTPFVQALESSSEEVVFWTTVTLGQLGDDARIAVPALCGIVKDYWQSGTRQAALWTLSKIAVDDQQAKEAVLIAFGDVNPFVRREALQAIIKFASLLPGDLEAIKRMEDDSDADVACWSEIALRNIRLRGSPPHGEVAG